MPVAAESHDFAAMNGERVLAYVRDAILKLIDRRRSYAKTSRKISGGTPDPELARELAAFAAAADMITYAIGAGQLAKAKGHPAPMWVLEISAQARAALIAPDDEQ